MVNFFYEKIINANNGLNLVDRTIKLGGALTENTTITGGDSFNFRLGSYPNGRLLGYQIFSREIVLEQTSAILGNRTKSFAMTDSGYQLIDLNSLNSRVATIDISSDISKGIGIGTINGINKYAYLRSDNLTSDRIFQFPNISGTLLTDTLSNATYARLDGTNQPFSGDISILNSGVRQFNLESTNNKVEVFLKGTNRYIYTYDTSGTLISTYQDGSITRSGQLTFVSSSNAILLSRTGLSSLRIATDIEANLSSEFRFRNSGGTITYVAVQQGANINNIRVTHSLKIGDTTQSATSATFGSIKASVNQYYGVVPNTTTPTWEKFAFVGMDKNITEVNAGTYNILSTDNIISIIVTCSATLPTITDDLVGKSYKIFMRDIPVTINRGGADLIDGAVSLNFTGYSMVTLIALKLGVWGVGQ